MDLASFEMIWDFPSTPLDLLQTLDILICLMYKDKKDSC